MEQKDIRKQLLPLMFQMFRRIKSEIAYENVSMASFLHVGTLLYIQEKGMPSMSDIAEYLKVARPTATSLVNTLIKEGILERVNDPEDRRRVLLRLSTKGIKELDATLQSRNNAFARSISHLSESDCHELARILSSMTQPEYPLTDLSLK
jgi:DNA-binding MarR family transcriptional regulator